MTLSLTPLTQADRGYITDCEQNPFLAIRVNINDRIASVFDFLNQKWTLPREKLVSTTWTYMPGQNALLQCALELEDRPQSKIRLCVDCEKVKIHKLHVEISEDNSPPMSLGKLKRDYDAMPSEAPVSQKKSHDSNTGKRALITV